MALVFRNAATSAVSRAFMSTASPAAAKVSVATAPVTEFPTKIVTPPSAFPTKSTPLTSGIPEYDALIVGGGVTGTALLYQLSKFTDLKSIGLVERRNDFATVASGPNNNSQTIHCGDIETNYTVEKATTVKRQADLLRNYGTRLPAEMRDRSIYKMQKMVLGVGEDECDSLEARYETFKHLFPKMQLANKQMLRRMEPNVVRVTDHRDRKETVNAIVIEDEHSAVNYFHLSHSFVAQAKEAAGDKNVDVKLNTEVRDIVRNADDTFLVHTNNGVVKTKFVVVSACGYSLLMAQRLGYGRSFGCFPVAGSFYFSRQPVLRGKVYTVQDPKLPFSAVHGDPDVQAQGLSRFGPTALPLPLLERFNLSSFKDFLLVSNVDVRLISFFFRMFRDRSMLTYALKNVGFEIPHFGHKMFLRDAQKIVPGLTYDNLVYAKGYGGIRPQLIDKQEMKLVMGEGKILGRNAIFNITPSPGGTTCLGNGEKDMRMICKTLGANIDEDLYKKTLLEGEYNIDYC